MKEKSLFINWRYPLRNFFLQNYKFSTPPLLNLARLPLRYMPWGGGGGGVCSTKFHLDQIFSNRILPIHLPLQSMESIKMGYAKL